MQTGNSGGSDRERLRSRARNPKGSSLETAVARYLEHGLNSDGSRSTMRTPLNGFIEFCHREGIERVDELTSSDLREYGLSLRERHIDEELKASTANTYFKYVRAFLSFCVRDELLESNPANTHQAEEFLPEDNGERERQFWTSQQRTRLIGYATERVDMALDETIDVTREVAFRDRAIVVLLADAGVRGAEVFRDPRDSARDGVTWGDVDLESGTLEVLGKSRNRETVGLPSAGKGALERLKRVQAPPSVEWAVFPTDHAPSKYAAYRDETGEDVPEDASIDELLRKDGVAPPAITKGGARRVLKRLTNEAGIEVEGSYLKPHGARRALGAELYEKGHSELAQSALRHKSIETTHEAYSDIQATDVAKGIDEVRK